MKPFDTKGVTPAAGYTSTVEDLGKFASWQFRLLRTGKENVLKASTLREMQRVAVLANGFAWRGETYPSLSGVAFAITGTHWNGPRFFGLRDKAANGASP